MSDCQCQICCFSRSVSAEINKLEDPSSQEFFLNLYDMLIHTEMDRDHYKAIIEGKWPNADDLIKRRREKLQN